MGMNSTQTQSVIFEEHVVAIDFAGRLLGDSMDGIADPQTFTPAFAHGIEDAFGLALSNGDVLGASNAWAILAGPAFPDGPHEIPIGGQGNENIILANEGSAPFAFHDLGIKVIPGASYTISFQVTGDAAQDFGCSFEIKFQDDEVRQRKFWRSRNVTTAVVDVDIPGVTLLAAALPNVPLENSLEIGGTIRCMAGDMAALGVNHGIAKISNCVDAQEVLLGGVGGELIVGSGAHVSPTQSLYDHILLKEKTPVNIQFRSIIEAGIVDCALSLGFVHGG